MAMFDPNANAQQQIPPEVVAQILALSTSKDKASDLDRQLRLSESLLGDAFEGPKTAPSSTAGGLAYVLGKGISGYTGGKMYAKNRADMESLRGGQAKARGSYFDLLNKGPGMVQQPAGAQTYPYLAAGMSQIEETPLY